ncbi:MAG TPA: hypothetical protein VIV14_11060 [Gammaproteobacteria bacterium]
MSSYPDRRKVAAWSVAAAVVLASPLAVSQGWIEESVCPVNTPSEFHVCALEAAASFDPPRTASGHPDLGGDWMLPGGQTGGAYEDLEEHPGELDALGGAAAVVDPPDGMLPIMPWAAARADENATGFVHHNAACFLAGVPNTMYHGGARQFLQTDDALVITTYNSHGWRVIHLDGRPQLDDDIRLWNGDSRGHWEGNTLVIETTNQNARPFLDQRGRFFTEDAHVTERVTLVDANTMHYEATVDDPNVFTRPFTIVQPYRRISVVPYEMPELACYENNEELMQIYRDVGLRIYPGIAPEEAREAAGE